MLSLTQLKKLFKDGLDYANKNSSWFYPPIEDLDELQNSLVQSAPDLTTLMSAVRIPNPNIGAAFWTPKPVCDNCLLKNTQPLWGQANTGWYFFVGNFGKMVYCITFFRLEVAPPQVFKGQNRGDAVTWLIGGGYGTSVQDWSVIPYEYVQMTYVPLTYSTFTLEGKGTKYIESCSLKTITPMTFTFSIDYTDAKGAKHSIQTSQQSLTPPQAAAPNAFLFNVPNIGSLYWSYTNMDVTSVINGVAYSKGKGWMDHQNLKISNPTGFFRGTSHLAQVVATVGKTITGPKITGWTWMFIQDQESGIQYMFSTALPKNYHSTPSSFKPGLVLPKASVCNVYKDAVPLNNPSNCSDLRIEVTKTQTVGGHPYPLEYHITLPGGKEIISRAMHGLNLFVNGPSVSCESPGLVYDKTGKKTIGYSLLELNGPLTFAETTAQLIGLSGAKPTDASVSAIDKGVKGYQPMSRKVVAWIITLLPLALFILFIILIFVWKQQRWERFGLFVAIWLAIQVIFAAVMIVSLRRQ
jgi:hypothetical protein